MSPDRTLSKDAIRGKANRDRCAEQHRSSGHQPLGWLAAHDDDPRRMGTPSASRKRAAAGCLGSRAASRKWRRPRLGASPDRGPRARDRTSRVVQLDQSVDLRGDAARRDVDRDGDVLLRVYRPINADGPSRRAPAEIQRPRRRWQTPDPTRDVSFAASRSRHHRRRTSRRCDPRAAGDRWSA